jgi:hypothetical protein
MLADFERDILAQIKSTVLEYNPAVNADGPFARYLAFLHFNRVFFAAQFNRP